MKKILSIALVALLAGSAFAAFSGNASVALGYNWETGAYGFTNGTGLDFDIDLATAEGEAIADAPVYAGIKATFALKVANIEGKKGYGQTLNSVDGATEDAGLGVFAEVAEAYVAGENWKVSILGTQGAPDFAKSAIETKDAAVKDVFGNEYDTKDTAVTYKVAANDLAGVTVEAYDWKASFGFVGNSGKGQLSTATKEKSFDYNAFVQTPSFDFDVVNFQLAAIASSNTTAEDKYDSAIGASAKVGFASDIVTGSVAADYGVKLAKNAEDKYDATHGLDVAANMAISPVTLDVYFMNDKLSSKTEGDAKLAENLLSAQVKADLTSFDVPVAITAYGKNMLDKIDGQDFGGKVAVTLDAFSVSVDGGYVIGTEKLYLGADVAYTADLFTAKAGIDWSLFGKADKDNQVLALSASIESSTLIPGATLSLAYGAAKEKMNLLDKQVNSDVKAQNAGKVEAKVKIAF